MPDLVCAFLAYSCFQTLTTKRRCNLSNAFACIGVIPFMVVVYFRFVISRVNLPSNVLNTVYAIEPNFLDQDTVESLLKLTRQNELPSNVRDTQFYTRPVEHEH